MTRTPPPTTPRKPPPTKRAPRLTMASNSFRQQELEAILTLFAKAELAPDTREIARSDYAQAVKVKFVKMKASLLQRRAAQAFHIALENASRSVAEPVRPSARRGR